MGRISPNWQKNPLCAWRIGRGGWSFGCQRKFRRPLDYWDLCLRGSSSVNQRTVINWWDHRAAACEGRSYWHIGYEQVSENILTHCLSTGKLLLRFPILYTIVIK